MDRNHFRYLNYRYVIGLHWYLRLIQIHFMIIVFVSYKKNGDVRD